MDVKNPMVKFNYENRTAVIRVQLKLRVNGRDYFGFEEICAVQSFSKAESMIFSGRPRFIRQVLNSLRRLEEFSSEFFSP